MRESGDGDADDPVLLITGASSGIGAATARAAAGSHRLVLAARSIDPLEQLAAELGGEERALAVRCDVTEWDQVEAMAAAGIERFGRIDGVFANAGFGASRGFLEESVEHWRSMVLTNVYGVALTIRATLPHLLERGDGHVIVTSSIAGRRVLPGSLYSATKWAATAIGEALRAELRQMHENHGIRVTADRARDDRHALLRQPARRLGAQGRRHRPSGDVRDRAAGRASTSTRS